LLARQRHKVRGIPSTPPRYSNWSGKGKVPGRLLEK
jgi:hypothetical protein